MSAYSTWDFALFECMLENNQATGYASQHIWCLSQARINWEGCARNGIWHKNGGDGRDRGWISLDGVAVRLDCWCVCLCYLHFAPENPEDGKIYLLVRAHPGCPGQSPESSKLVVCVNVCLVKQITRQWTEQYCVYLFVVMKILYMDMCVDFWCREDKSQLNKLVEAVKTNFNDRADEVGCYCSTFIVCVLPYCPTFWAVLSIHCVSKKNISNSWQSLCHIRNYFYGATFVC